MEGTFRGSTRKVRAELGLTSFGVQTIDLPPGSTRHPWHDHVEDGQEEMYIALEGGGVLELESGERFPLERDCAIRVGPAERPRVLAGPDGIRMLIDRRHPRPSLRTRAPNAHSHFTLPHRGP